MPGSPTASRRRPTQTRSIHARAAEVIGRQRERMARSLGSAIDGRDPAGVHDMRVATRRLRAALETFAAWLDPDEVERASASLRRVTRVLGRVRELDVLRIRLAGLAARAKPERKLAIEMVDSRLSRLRRRARARMMKRFAAVDLDRLDLQLRRLTGAPPEPVSVDGLPLEAGPHVALMAPLDAPATIPIDELLERAAPEMAGAAKALVDADIPGVVGSSEAMEALHRVRIQAKKLRYGLEIVAVDRGASGSARVEELRELQDALGDLHDDTVLDAVLRDAMARQVERGRPLLARELRRLRSARRRALNRAERACRAALTALRERGFADAVAEVFRADSLPPSSASATVANASEEAEPGEPGTDASGSLHLAGR